MSTRSKRISATALCVALALAAGAAAYPGASQAEEFESARAERAGSAKQARLALRVHGPDGSEIASVIVHSASRSVRSSKRALCMGPGTAGSGKRVPTVHRGPSALGALADAAAEVGALRPLRISDAFASSFGLALCGIGGYESDPVARYWAFWVDGVFGQSAADYAPVRGGSTVVYALRPAADYPAEELPQAAPRSGRQLVVGAQGARPVRGTGRADRLLVRDGSRDRVRCGAGSDLVIADASDRLDPDCEEARRR